MPQDFSGKVALVSGAASGIGRATSDLLAACGASVFEVDIKYTRGRVERSENNVARYGADLTQEAQARESVESCVNTLGALHVVCNCAGIEMKGNVVELPTESFEKVIETNVK
ncbi:MAG: SDR family NAD(P)-dependent oxidoreductase, partial [Nitrososphaerota archaeon]|nr:SDR family NAD(P)-dependent oxidoreductase [Nitrososphaerota archaeon]